MISVLLSLKKSQYGLGFKLTLQRNIDCNVLSHTPQSAVGDANGVIQAASEAMEKRFFLSAFLWYVPHYTPKFSQQKLKLEQIVSIPATNLPCIETSV